MLKNAPFWCTSRDQKFRSLPIVSLCFRLLYCAFEKTLRRMNFNPFKFIFMLGLLEIRFSFLCRSTRANDDGKCPIILRIAYRSERRDIYTGLYCNPEKWDSENTKVAKGSKNAVEVNRNLELINRKAHQVFDHLRFSDDPFTIDELVDKLKGREQKPTLLIDFLREGIEEVKQRVGIDITNSTYGKYERSLRFVIIFLQTKLNVKNYPLAKLDGKFLEKYFQYLRNDRKIQNNTAVKYMKIFKTILTPAVKSGIIINDPFAETKFKTKTIYKGFLTDEEITKIANLNMSEDLTRIRDQYLFCCYTGLAYSDLKQLSKNHFVCQKDGEFHILKRRQKTNQQSIIPLLPIARNILLKYSPTNDFRNFSWYVSANQKMNQRLKTIASLAGLTKTLHMHLARHTFATTITLANGVPIESVSNMLGHTSIRQTQHYAKIVARRVINDMSVLKQLYK
jgi:site-specific recombinase XerD